MVTGLPPAGFPHSDIPGSTPACGSPRLFAACHVLLRQSVPRHPPCALLRLICRRLACSSTRLLAPPPAFPFALLRASRLPLRLPPPSLYPFTLALALPSFLCAVFKVRPPPRGPPSPGLPVRSPEPFRPYPSRFPRARCLRPRAYRSPFTFPLALCLPSRPFLLPSYPFPLLTLCLRPLRPAPSLVG